MHTHIATVRNLEEPLSNSYNNNTPYTEVVGTCTYFFDEESTAQQLYNINT